MPVVNPNGVVTPAGPDPYALTADLRTMALTTGGIAPAANSAEQDAILAEWVNADAAPSLANPVFVFRTDEDQLYVHKGSGWQWLGGATPWVVCAPSAAVTGGSMRARREGDSVRLDGRLNAASWTHGNLMFTLPVGYRPTSFKYLTADARGGGASVPSSCRVTILEGGQAYVQNVPAGTTEVSLNISFITD